ncbi:MAG: alkyl/aryl-sulfatase [Burkholderiales bacterium]|nr:alkyl/aryl-sulfatase [Burkholderiales bacterium]
MTAVSGSSPYDGGSAGIATGPNGALASPALIAQGALLEKRLYTVAPGIWSAVGYGMSNSVAIAAPDGLIVIDTGEGLEESAEHLAAFRGVTAAPVRAVIYSHSHYAHGTPTWQKEAGAPLPIWGHARLRANVSDVAAEIGPAYSRRARAQFSFYLPDTGPDAMPNQGLGPLFFHKDRATTRRFVAPTEEVGEECTVTIAGTRVHFVPAASDSDDTLIIGFPDLDCVVNNHIWPVLFNIYTLRGEAYRDPLQLVRAIDRIRAMDPLHLVGVHGPPISGRDRVRQALADHRDSIQFLWDQTVRGINDGLAIEEIVARVKLPPRLAASPYIPPCYGEVPYHVRAIHNGVLGWYDMDAARLHPLPPAEEARRMVAGFGGRAAMTRAVDDALAARNWSWAAQLANYLMRDDPADAGARTLKARALRGIAQVTSAANTRSICLTEALTLEGQIDPMAESAWRANRFQVMNAPPLRFLEALRVQLDPARAAAADIALDLHLTDRDVTGSLHVIGGVARFAPAAHPRAELRLALTQGIWADLYAGKRTLAQAVADGAAAASPSADAVAAFFDLFDHVHLR